MTSKSINLKKKKEKYNYLVHAQKPNDSSSNIPA